MATRQWQIENSEKARAVAGLTFIIGIIVVIFLITRIGKGGIDYVLHLLFFYIPAIAVIIGIALAVSGRKLKCPSCGYEYITKENVDSKQ